MRNFACQVDPLSLKMFTEQISYAVSVEQPCLKANVLSSVN